MTDQQLKDLVADVGLTVTLGGALIPPQMTVKDLVRLIQLVQSGSIS